MAISPPNWRMELWSADGADVDGRDGRERMGRTWTDVDGRDGTDVDGRDGRRRTGRTWTDGTDVDGRGRTWTDGTDVDGRGRTGRTGRTGLGDDFLLLPKRSI